MLWASSSPMTRESRDEALPAASLPGAASHGDGDADGSSAFLWVCPLDQGRELPILASVAVDAADAVC